VSVTQLIGYLIGIGVGVGVVGGVIGVAYGRRGAFGFRVKESATGKEVKITKRESTMIFCSVFRFLIVFIFC